MKERLLAAIEKLENDAKLSNAESDKVRANAKGMTPSHRGKSLLLAERIAGASSGLMSAARQLRDVLECKDRLG